MTPDNPVRFTLDEAQAAADTWGMNCGPGAIAAVLGLTLDELRPSMGDFERKGYTNPTLMWAILNAINARWYLVKPPSQWPRYGLARVQWEGPWTAPNVPPRVAYRHTHWVGSRIIGDNHEIFDINAMCAGGWISKREWAAELVPWLLKECEPKASGHWHLTHSVEVESDAG